MKFQLTVISFSTECRLDFTSAICVDCFAISEFILVVSLEICFCRLDFTSAIRVDCLAITEFILPVSLEIRSAKREVESLILYKNR